MVNVKTQQSHPAPTSVLTVPPFARSKPVYLCRADHTQHVSSGATCVKAIKLLQLYLTERVEQASGTGGIRAIYSTV